MRLFRERLLARLVEAHAISQELVCRLVCWRHPGFSAHVGERFEPENKEHLEDTGAYLVRNPLSLRKLVYLGLIAFVTGQLAIGKILEHLGLSTPEAAKPPPPAREVLRVAEHGDGWGVPAQWE
jgi:hypothetical protein